MITVRSILRVVSEAFDIREAALTGASRDNHTALARAVAAHCMRTLCGYSYPRIGRELRRDHSSMLIAIRKLTARMETDAELSARVDAIRAALVGTPSEDAPVCVECLRRESELRELLAHVDAMKSVRRAA